MTEKIIKFYHAYEENGEFSNYYESKFYLDNKSWPSVEHYFQAQKFIKKDNDDENKIIMKEKAFESVYNAKTPDDAKKLSKVYNEFKRSDWYEVRDDVMYKAVKAKFIQNNMLSNKLLKTQNAILQENSKKDTYWGNGGDTNNGKNKLGEILMKVRGEFNINN